MVKTLLYCSEQIAIPEVFPNILKTYAKAAIRTQPYDLLRWSAAYFRCLANDVPPPVKTRLEKECKHGSITKGYLRVLLDQTPLDTMNMICELLTDDVEGGRARVPIWMFRVCYTFVAELDCSEEQYFVNGRKKLASGDLEEVRSMGKVPQVFSATSLRQAIFDSCTQRYNINCRCNESFWDSDVSSEKSHECPVHRGSASSISSGFQFMGSLNNPVDVLRRYNDFDSLILLLREAQGALLHDYEGPFKISQKLVEHAKLREEEIFVARERQALANEIKSKQYLEQERANMLREVGPPWTWLHQFAEENCIDKSYNFVEDQSIISDVTPTDSSDESFDFCKEKPVGYDDIKSQPDSEVSSSDHVSQLIREDSISETCIDKDPADVIKSLLADGVKNREVDVTDSSSMITFLCKEEHLVLQRAGQPAVSPVDIQNIIRVIEAASQKGVQFRSIDEIMDYVKYWQNREDEMYIPIVKDAVVMEKEQKITHHEEAEEIQKIISSQKPGELHDKEMKSVLPELGEPEPKTSAGEEFAEEEITGEVEEEEEQESSQKTRDQKSESSEVSGVEAAEESVTSKLSEDLQKDVELSKDDNVKEDMEYVPIDEIREDEERIPMGNIFADSGTLPEENKIGQEGSCTILGLVDKEEMIEEEGSIEEEQSSITPSGTVSGRGDISDDSSKLMISERSDDVKRRRFRAYACQHSESSDSLCTVTEGFCCVIPAYPGIGAAVSKKTIQDFVTYLKMRSRCQKGMIMPGNFKESKCPRISDTCNE